MNSILFNKRNSYYFNGNYLVYYNYSGKTYKRCLRANEELKADFPDSIDLKITNKCNHNCWYCHENSISSGNSFDINKTIEILKQLPNVPIEVAIGGGNVLDIAQDTLNLIEWCNSYGLKPRITINHKDIDLFKIKYNKEERNYKEKLCGCEKLYCKICDSVEGIGISLDPSLLPPITTDNYYFNKGYKIDIIGKDEYIENNKVTNLLQYKNLVFHIIAGLFPIDKLKELLSYNVLKSLHNILILGYKQFGRAANTKLPDSLSEFEKIIKEFIINSRNNYMASYNIAFDNLALEQLHMKEFIDKDNWDSLYLGEEGTCSMYIDAVNGTYSKSSTSIDRVSWNDIGLLEFFKSL